MAKMQPKMLKAMVLGANDGIITTFAVVAGVVGAGLPTPTIIILGIANMTADAISMSLGDFLGEQSVNQLEKKKISAFHHFFRSTSWKTFIAFFFAGSLPLIPYLIHFVGVAIEDEMRFPLSMISTACGLFIVGSMRTIITKHGWLRSGLEMLGIGAAAAGVSYLLGKFIEQLIS